MVVLKKKDVFTITLLIKVLLVVCSIFSYETFFFT